MSDTNHLMTVFSAALDCGPGAERLAYLDRACRGDPALRAEVAVLLSAHDRAGDFLEPRPEHLRPTAAFDEPTTATIDHGPNPEAGTVVAGRYALKEVIGEGGMGTVWMAEQTEPVRREVALKVIKAGMDSRQVLARFEVERQALALMDHPNIARVLDGGATAGGRPFFVMELVRGVPITAYCDERRVPLRERLALFVDVCHAVQHAHQKGVIHRDLKPNNVLVARYGDSAVPKVIDFGIAKATAQVLTEKSLYTGLGGVVGTPEYMSPEQAGLNNRDVDTRSDIYALGALLYELLTGSTPLTHQRSKEAPLLEVLRLVREAEPPKPSARLSSADNVPTVAANRGVEPRGLGRQLRGDLDWIVMKALDKDRARRYDTAAAFAADIQRHLRNEPVLACPPTLGYRLRKFVRRNRAGLAVTGLVLAFVIFLGGGVGWVVRDQALRQADTERRVDDFLHTAAQLRDQKRWSEAREAARQAQLLLATQEGHAELRRRLGDIFAELDMIARLEQVRLDMTAIKDNTWDRAGADTGYSAAFRDFGINVAELSTDAAAASVRASPIREELIAALDDWLAILPAAEAARREQVRAVVSRADSDPWRKRFRDPAVQKDRRALVELAAHPEVAALPPPSVVLLGRALRDVGAAQQAVNVLDAAQRRAPADVWLNLELAKTFRWHFQPPRYDEAAGYMRAALAIRPNSAGINSGLGSSLHTPAHLDDAIASYRRAIELDPNFADPRNALARALVKKGLWNEAIDSYLTVIRMRPDWAQAYFDLAWAYRMTHATEKAIAAYEEAARVQPKFLAAHHELAWLLANCPEPRFRDPKRALEIAERHLSSRADTVDHLLMVGTAKYRTGDAGGALASLTRAHERAKSGNVYVWFFLSMAHAKNGDPVQARSWYDSAVRGTEERREWVASISIVGEDLFRFRAEAAGLLGIENLPGPWPQKQKSDR